MSNSPRIRTDRIGKTIALVFDPATVYFAMDGPRARAFMKAFGEQLDIIDPPKVRRGSRIDPDWQPDAVLIAWTAEKRPDLNLPVTRDGFVDFWVGKAGKDGIKLDWAATWRNWCRNQKHGEAPKQQPLPAEQFAPDKKRCLRCAGTGLWYPKGFGGGVAQCREHEWAVDELEPAPPEVVVAIEDYVRKERIKAFK